MRTDTELIESFLLQKLTPEEKSSFFGKRASEPLFNWNLLAQAKVHLAALRYGRNLRRANIMAASDKAFADKHFVNVVTQIFK